MLIKNPSSPYPQNITVDPDSTYLSFTFKGDRLGCYKIKIYSYPENANVYESEFINVGKSTDDDRDNYIYNDKRVEFNTALNELENSSQQVIETNKSYTWEIVMSPEISQQTKNENLFTSLRYFFQTAPTPVISQDPFSSDPEFIINEFPFDYTLYSSMGLSSKNLNVSGYYYWGDIKYYYFQLFDDDNNLIDETNKIFSTKIDYNFSGLLNSKTYILRFYSVSQSDLSFSKEIKFKVTYSSKIDIGNPPILTYNENEANVEIKWAKDSTAIGRPTGTYKIIENKVEIKTGTIIYDNISSSPITMDANNFALGIKTTVNNNTTKILDYINNNVLYELYIENYEIYLRYGTIGSTIKTTTNFGAIKSSIDFGIQNYDTAANDTGYMWYDDNRTFNENGTYLLIAQEEEVEIKILLQKENGTITCKELTSEGEENG